MHQASDNKRSFLRFCMQTSIVAGSAFRPSFSFSFQDPQVGLLLEELAKKSAWDPERKTLSSSPIGLPRINKARLVYLDFWASWCTPCRQSFPFMNHLHDKYSHIGLLILAVSVDKDRMKFEDFLIQTPPRFAVLWDRDALVTKLASPSAMPTSYIIKDLAIVGEHRGFNNSIATEAESKIQNALRL